MDILNVIVIIVFAANIIFPLLGVYKLNIFSHCAGWLLALMWFCVAVYG